MAGARTELGSGSRAGSGTNSGSRRSFKKTLLLVLGGIVALVVVLLAFAPTIAGSIAPGLIERSAGKSMPGKVKVSGVKLGWGSSQVIGPVTISDESGAEVADVTVRVSRGLLGLARAGLSGGGDFGTITILGRVHVVREKDGTTNLERALGIKRDAPSGGGAGVGGGGGSGPGPQGEAKLPPGLKAELALDAFEIVYIDKTQAVEEKVTAKNLSARVSVEAGKPLALTMSGDAYRGSGGAGAPVGKIAIDARVEGWSDASGRLTTRSARGDVSAKVTALPVGLIDAFARSALPQGVAPRGLGDALGDSLDVVVTAKGDARDGEVFVHAIFPRASASAVLNVKDGVASAKNPIVVKAQGSAIRSLLPAIDEALAKGQVTLVAIPDVQLAVDNLRARLPREGGALDLRGGGAVVTLTMGSASGSVAVDRSEGASPRPFTLSDTQFRIDAPDFSGPVRVTASGQAAVDGRAAGTLDADLTLAGLLDASGVPVKGMPGSISGKAALRGIQTAIAQPIFSRTPLDLPTDIGPTLDVELTAVSAGGEGGTTDINLMARSRQLSADGVLRLDASGLSTREAGVRASLSGLGSVARKFMPADSGWSMVPASGAGDGMGEVLVTGLVVPMVDGTPQIDKAVGRVQVKLADFSISPKVGGSPVGLRTLALVAALGQGVGAGGAPHVEFDARGTHEGQEFNAVGTLDLPGLLAFANGKIEVRPAAVRPAGRVDVADIPTSLAGLVMPRDASDPGAVDTGRLVRELLGPKLALRLAATPAKDSDAADLSIVTESQFSKVTLGAIMSRAGMTLSWMEGQVNVTPAAADVIFAAKEPDATRRMRLSGPAYLALGVREPVSVPLDKEFKPDLARAGVLRARLGTNGEIAVENLAPGAGTKTGGGAQEVGRVASLKDFGVDVQMPMSGLAPLAQPAPGKATFSGTLLERGSPAGALSGVADFALAGGKPSGEMKIAAKLAQVRGTLLEAFAGKPGLVTGAVGESLDVDVGVTVSPQAGAAAGVPLDFGKAGMEVSLSLAAPRLKTSGPMVLVAGEDRITLRSPARLSFEAQPSWVNTMLATEAAGAAPAMTLTQPTLVEVEILRLAISRGAGPLKPGVFGVELSAKINALALQTADKQQLSVTGVSAHVTGSDVVVVKLLVARAGVAGQPAGENLGLDARVLGLAGPNGEVSLETARLVAEGKFVSVPTALLDALARQKGLLVEALGASCDAMFSAMDVPLSPKNTTSRGLLTADFKSPRASAKLKGTVGEGVFESDGPIEASLSEVTAALSAYFVKGLPFVGSVEKGRNDAPAMIVASGLSVPLAGDMSKLSGEIRITPGEAKFSTSDVFGKLLELAQAQGGAAMVGRRLEPITITAKNGVIIYPRYKLPLGEFTVETEGNVNLVDRTINVVTYVPAGALADETLGLFRVGGGLDKVLGKSPIKLDRMSMLPFRTKGSLDGAKTAPDLELFAKSFTGQLKPETILEQGGDLLKDLIPKKKK